MVGRLALIGVLAAALARGQGVALTNGSVGEGRTVALSCGAVWSPSYMLGKGNTVASCGAV
jgi:hypothetical protein